MPTYAYACTDCGHDFEAVQSFTDDSLTVCPQCAGRLRKVFANVGVVFKGSGFYRNDSRDQSSGNGSSGQRVRTSPTRSPTRSDKKSDQKPGQEVRPEVRAKSSGDQTVLGTGRGQGRLNRQRRGLGGLSPPRPAGVPRRSPRWSPASPGRRRAPHSTSAAAR